MIRSIEIENFRGIQQGKLNDLTPLTILVGPNGCGKSSILDAIYVAAHRDPAVALQYIVKSRLRLADATQWVLWKTIQESRCGLRIEYDTGAQRAVILGQQNLAANNALRGLSASFQNLESLLGKQLGTNSVGARSQGKFAGGGGFGQVGQVGQATLASLAVGDIQSGNEVDLVDLTEPPQPGYLVDLFTKTRVAGRREEVTGLVRSVIPNAETIEILTENGKPIIHVGYRSTSVPAALSGDGIHDLLRLCLKLASRPDGIVLLEEPEVHQHPRALRQSALAVLAAVRRGIQVVLTTHNLELIDYLISETASDEELNRISVVRLQLKDGCLKSIVVSGQEASFARAQIQDDLR